ncbi:MAG: FRG domain-containing protein, partial [Solirubrobacteraceae bacterium]
MPRDAPVADENQAPVARISTCPVANLPAVEHLGDEKLVDDADGDGNGNGNVAVVNLGYWGRAWAPATLSEFVRVVQRRTSETGEPEVWRGQSRLWPLHSGALRRFGRSHGWLGPALHDTGTLESYIADYETALVAHARLDGHGETAGRRRSDLEVLGLLQHHGAATRLLDFSLNCFIALWFACRADADDYGILVGLDLTCASEAFREEAVEAPLSVHQGQGLHFWRPWGLSPRMPAQASVLVWSQVVRLGWGTVGYRDDEGPKAPNTQNGPSAIGPGTVSIAISPDLKRHLAAKWEPVFGYSERWLFPDI